MDDIQTERRVDATLNAVQAMDSIITDENRKR